MCNYIINDLYLAKSYKTIMLNGMNDPCLDVTSIMSSDETNLHRECLIADILKSMNDRLSSLEYEKSLMSIYEVTNYLVYLYI